MSDKYNLDQWMALVGSSITLKKPSDCLPIALICMGSDAAGLQCGTWHASALFYGYVDKCHCGPCERKRAAWVDPDQAVAS